MSKDRIRPMTDKTYSIEKFPQRKTQKVTNFWEQFSVPQIFKGPLKTSRQRGKTNKEK